MGIHGQYRLDDARGEGVMIVSGRDAAERSGRDAAAIDPERASWSVSDWFPDGWSDGRSQEVLQRIGGEVFGAAASTQEELLALRERVRDALRSGALVALRALPLTLATSWEMEEPEPLGERVAPREEKTWVAIGLVTDDDPPRPVPSKRYRIELPDGSVIEGSLDGNGLARITGIDPGDCKVSFPDLDAKDWRRA